MVILLPQTLEFSILNFLPSPPCEGVIHGQILDVVMVWQEQWDVTISEVLPKGVEGLGMIRNITTALK